MFTLNMIGTIFAFLLSSVWSMSLWTRLMWLNTDLMQLCTTILRIRFCKSQYLYSYLRYSNTFRFTGNRFRPYAALSKCRNFEAYGIINSSMDWSIHLTATISWRWKSPRCNSKAIPTNGLTSLFPNYGRNSC